MRKKAASYSLIAVLIIFALVVLGIHRAHAQQAATSIPSIVSVPPAAFTKTSNIFTTDFTVDLGTVITLNGLVGTRTITGLLTTDHVLVQAVSALPTGVGIVNAYVSSADTLSIRFLTAVLGNVALGSQTYRVTVFR